jgi:hypothetical protein
MRLSVIVISVFFMSCPLWSQSCLPNTSLVQNAADTYPAGTDGIVHLAYSFVDTSGTVVAPDANTSTAFGNAIAAWNASSATTGVQFSPAPPGQQADLQIQLTTDDSGNTGGCAAYNSNTGRIYIGETFAQAVQSTSVGTTIISHELGHVLGLADGGTNPNPPSIMNNPSNPPPGACTAPQVPTTQVQPSDATAVKACVVQGRTARAQLDKKTNNKFILDSPYTIVQTSAPTCYYTYGTEYFYVNGELDSTQPYLASVTCQ